MIKSLLVTFMIICFALTFAPVFPAQAEWKAEVVKKVSGLGHPEAVVFDEKSGHILVSRFGPVLKPTQKDGEGYISRLTVEGEIETERFLPQKGKVINKPKGMFVEWPFLWVTDIDSLWLFNMYNGKGRNVSLPGAKFANDVIKMDGKLFVSDTGGHRIFRVSPANFMPDDPEVEVVLTKKGMAPNGLAEGLDGSLLIGAYPGAMRGSILKLENGDAREVSKPLGKIDGLAVLPDGTMLFSDWSSGSLNLMTVDGSLQTLLEGVKGPADFAVIPSGTGYRVILPDLVEGDLYFIKLEQADLN